MSDVVAPAVPLAALLANNLPLDEAFVLSRVVLGQMPVREVVRLCQPHPETEVIAVLGRLLRAGFIQT